MQHLVWLNHGEDFPLVLFVWIGENTNNTCMWTKTTILRASNLGDLGLSASQL